MEKHPICILKTIQYSEKLVGIPCVESFQNPKEDAPFYTKGKKYQLEFIKKEGISDVGLFNLLRTFNKLPIPGRGKIDYYPEGTMEAWVFVFKKKLIKFKKNLTLPLGTLLFSNNHMALLIKKNKILHCNLKKGIVCIEEMYDNFDYFCLPKNWILTE